MKPLRRLPLMLLLVASASAPAASPDHPVAYPMETLRQEMRDGGPGKDGIPSIDAPRFRPASESALRPGDRVIGVYRDGEARAYPQRILVWHEIVNDTFGGEAVSITYCPLTGSALGFAPGTGELGVSGRLLNSNLVMYDRDSDSTWPQLLGLAIDGPREGEGLEEFRVFWTTWERWRARHPETRVLTEQTGYVRNYRRDPYGSYDPLGGYYRPESRRLFPVLTQDDRFPPKTEVLGFRTPDGAAAVTQAGLADEDVIEVPLGESHYTVVHDPGLETGWVFHNPERRTIVAGDLTFTAEGVSGGGVDGLDAVNAFEVMWFAWVAFYPDTRVHGGTP